MYISPAAEADSFQACVEHAPVGIFRSTVDGRIVLVNRALVAMLGYADSAALMAVRAADLAAVRHDGAAWIRDIARDGVVRHFETRLRRADGAEVWVELNGRAITDAAGHLLCYEGVAIDISRRKLAEEGLKTLAQQIERSFEQTIQSVVTIMEKRDPYTSVHMRRVAHLATALAGEMGLGADQARGIHLGALMHDVGKFFIPLEILCRPGRLDPMEIELIRHHPRHGYDVVKQIETRWPIADMVLQHHERLDGCGYPNRLGRAEIPLESRILSVADTVEAMAEHRPYRPSLGIDAALAEVAAHAGTHYDPEVVQACQRLFRSGHYQFASDDRIRMAHWPQAT